MTMIKQRENYNDFSDYARVPLREPACYRVEWAASCPPRLVLWRVDFFNIIFDVPMTIFG